MYERHLLRPTLQPFLDKTAEPGDADYVLFGAPLDLTTSYRRGTRFAPMAIRRASIHMDAYSPRSGLDWEDLALADLGDLVGMDELERALQAVEGLCVEVSEAGKTPVMVGGEHTLTLAAIRALEPDLVVVFDGHLDLRDELGGERYCHATYLRRAHEELEPRILVLGARAMSREEAGYAEKHPEIGYVTSLEFIREGADAALERVADLLMEASSIYLSIDIDALDPSQAPAVGNPAPEGLTVTQLLDAVDDVADDRMTGLDLNEVSPHYDSGNTSTVAAYVLMETLYALEMGRRGRC